MFLPPVRPSTMPRPISSIVSVAMKAGTFRIVTSTPLIRPMTMPSNRQPRAPRKAEIEMGGRKDDREDDADKPIGRADRKIEILVDDDEGHANRHHAIAGGITQHRMQGVGAAEESRIDEGARRDRAAPSAPAGQLPSRRQAASGGGAQRGAASLSHEHPMKPIP